MVKMTNWRYEFRKLQLVNEKLKQRIKQLRALKCPPISDGDTCICPIEEQAKRIQELEADIKIKQSVCETIEKEVTEINKKLKKRIGELEGENKSLTEFAEEAWMQSGYHGCFTDWLEQEAPKFKFEPS